MDRIIGKLIIKLTWSSADYLRWSGLGGPFNQSLWCCAPLGDFLFSSFNSASWLRKIYFADYLRWSGSGGPFNQSLSATQNRSFLFSTLSHTNIWMHNSPSLQSREGEILSRAKERGWVNFAGFGWKQKIPGTACQGLVEVGGGFEPP